MAEKAFSVAAELEDGTAKVVTVHGHSSGDAFRAVQAMPGIRRVGRVTEVNGRDGSHSRTNDRTSAPAPGTREVRSTSIGIGHTLSGPRVVLAAPKSGGEQPFRHLKAPPERPKPPVPVQPPAPPVQAQLQQQPARPAAQAPAAPVEAAPVEYRIHKSRRKDGLPFLLQRGRWQDTNGKRAFSVEWEKGFDQREPAERHLEWVLQAETELTELQQSA